MATKSYLRYEPEATFGVISSGSANVLSIPNTQKILAPALEDVLIWDMRTSILKSRLKGGDAEVTAMALAKKSNQVAVGYANGDIRMFDIESEECVVTLSGHRAAVTSLEYDEEGVLLASGAKDTDIIVWDVVAEKGIYRLKGHKDEITQVYFMKTQKYLISSSKDTSIRCWDLNIQHCIQTIVGHRSEVCDFVLDDDETRMVTGSAFDDLKVWHITENVTEEEGKSKLGKINFVFFGDVKRQDGSRVQTIKIYNDEYIIVQGLSKTIEFYQLASDDDIQRRLKRRLKRLREKANEKKKASGDKDAPLDIDESKLVVTAADELKHLYNLRLNSAKTRSFDLCLSKATKKSGKDNEESIKIVIAYDNNMIEKHEITLKGKDGKSSMVGSLDIQGHRSGPRAIAVSDDGKLLVTCAKHCVKLWNIPTRACIRTIPSGNGLTCFIAPGGRHVVIGTKSGNIQLFDIASSTLLADVQAHDGPVWSLALRPDGRRFVSGGGDKLVKMWDFELVQDDNFSKETRRLGFEHETTLKMSDDVLCVKYSPDSKYLAVSLLDCTIKVFFQDSLKFFTSLYGHKLPVTRFDISADSTLLVSVSADKNVKLWGLDFGDCHKSIFAHSDTIMDVSFVHDTHYFFTVGKDKLLKYWDGDAFEHIITLNGHHSEVWSLAVSKFGHFVVTASHDRSIRVWERTTDLVYLHIERELEREKELENDIADDQNKLEKEGEGDSEVVSAGKQTAESMYASEKIIEAIELADTEANSIKEHAELCTTAKSKGDAEPAPRVVNQRFRIFRIETPAEYVLMVVRKIRSNDLEEALLVVPFTYALRLLHYIDEWMKIGSAVELSCRCLFFLLKLHHNQLTTNQVMVSTINSIRISTHKQVGELKDLFGFNMAALGYLKREMEETNVRFFEEAENKFETQVKHKRKRRKVIL